MKYFSYKPVALVNNLLGRDAQDLRKSMDEIKQQKIILNNDERNIQIIKMKMTDSIRY